MATLPDMDECTAEADEPETKVELAQSNPTSNSEDTSGTQASVPTTSANRSETVLNDQIQSVQQLSKQSGKL